jgi:hypothetical protein
VPPSGEEWLCEIKWDSYRAQLHIRGAADKDVLDAAIVGAAQSVEHYEIARYGTLIAWADSRGHDDIIRPNLNEESAADKKLSSVATPKGVNRKAASYPPLTADVRSDSPPIMSAFRPKPGTAAIQCAYATRILSSAPRGRL